MFNNRSYYQDVGHQLSVTRMRQRPVDNIGIGVSLEGPATDFATLAKSFGIYGDGPIVDPDAIRPALESGLTVVKENGTPALIDTVTQPR
jgi:acetolactate synthase I/II/III large subunit